MARKAFWFLLDAVVEAPAWALLLAGALLLAASLLTGPYLENQRLGWQRDLIRLQLQRLEEQEQAYQQLLLALDSDDPVLIQRLAYHYLKLKPAGAESIANPDNFQKPPGVMGAAYGKPGGPVPRPLAESMNNVDAWLYRPMPVVGKDYPPYPMTDTLLTKLVTGPARPTVAAIGGLLIAVGLIPMGGWPRKGTAAIERVISRPPTPLAPATACSSPSSSREQVSQAHLSPYDSAAPAAKPSDDGQPLLAPTPSASTGEHSVYRVQVPSETVSVSPPTPSAPPAASLDSASPA